jgi:hypothetical protein
MRRVNKRGAIKRHPEVEPMRNGCDVHLIRIATDSDQERALVAFRSVRAPVQSSAEDEFLVTAEHLAALDKAGVPFEEVTESLKHGNAAAG